MNTETITINGTDIAMVATGAVTWTAADTSLRLTPTMSWIARRGEHTGRGDTAQAAADNLLAAERKAEHAATLPKGQRFAHEMRTYLHIGSRTRRYRQGRDLHAAILECITNATWNRPGFYSEARQEAFRSGFDAWMSYDKHIAGYRVNGNVISHIESLSPYQFCNLLADMIDTGITNVGEGERYFQAMARRLRTQAA